jgi:hypothetical protein
VRSGSVPAGGRATGPALGGEADSVLSESLTVLGSRIDYRALRAASANGITTYAARP